MSNWLSDTITREVAYAEGYDAGKRAAAEEILEDLVKLGACSKGIVLDAQDIQELREKWGIE